MDILTRDLPQQQGVRCFRHRIPVDARAHDLTPALMISGVMSPKIILALLLILISFPGRANTDAFDIVAPPACFNNKGEAVVFRDVKNAGPKSAAGMANRDENGVPVVYRFNYHHSPQALQRFIDLHECAHHQTGDVDLPHPPRNSQAHLMNESIADCIATLRIRDEFDDGQDILASAIAELTAAMQAIGFPEITVESRISNITNCFQKAETATAFTDGVLEYRELK